MKNKHLELIQIQKDFSEAIDELQDYASKVSFRLKDKNCLFSANLEQTKSLDCSIRIFKKINVKIGSVQVKRQNLEDIPIFITIEAFQTKVSEDKGKTYSIIAKIETECENPPDILISLEMSSQDVGTELTQKIEKKVVSKGSLTELNSIQFEPYALLNNINKSMVLCLKISELNLSFKDYKASFIKKLRDKINNKFDEFLE